MKESSEGGPLFTKLEITPSGEEIITAFILIDKPNIKTGKDLNTLYMNSDKPSSPDVYDNIFEKPVNGLWINPFYYVNSPVINWQCGLELIKNELIKSLGSIVNPNKRK